MVPIAPTHSILEGVEGIKDCKDSQKFSVAVAAGQSRALKTY
jgi:hypothetical protein